MAYVKMINRFGTVMLVDEARVNEYLAKGNRLADQPVPKEAKKPTKKRAVKK